MVAAILDSFYVGLFFARLAPYQTSSKTEEKHSTVENPWVELAHEFRVNAHNHDKLPRKKKVYATTTTMTTATIPLELYKVFRQ